MKRIWIGSLLLGFLGFLRLYLPAVHPLPEPRKQLGNIEKAIATEIIQWSFSPDGVRGEIYVPGRTVPDEKGQFKSRIPGNTVFAGNRVQKTPLHLNLKLSCRGRCQVQVFIDRQIRESFMAGESSGRTVELQKEFLVDTEVQNRDYEIVLKVANTGFEPKRTQFWPERRTPLPEEGIGFSIQKAEIVYPLAFDNIRKVRDWVTSFRIADTLINPELVRYTFTKKPFAIPDRRPISQDQLNLLNRQWDQAILAFDTRAFHSGNWSGVEQSIERSYKLAKDIEAFARSFQVNLIGNAHIDIAWLWRISETMEVAHQTYETVMKNMSEYPELIYAQSQAQTYEWIEKKYPELFQKIQQKVKEGRWEIVGGMWVEPDCNLISGESWVRQLIFGKTYFKDKFGVDVRTGWNPDSFGYNWNMPQIYSKSGIDCFITQKLWWNDTTVFPHFLFHWQGVDDTRLLTYLPPLAYDTDLEMTRVLSGINKYQVTTGKTDSLVLYGLGDHGGGPNREILNRVRDYAKLRIAPAFCHSRVNDFLDWIRTGGIQDLPVWKDELYLEYHQGTFTTQAAIKKNNRQCESRLAVAEKAASISQLLGNPYPADELPQIWKAVLTNQFHDILPGSSITPVYHDALEMYARAQEKIRKLIDKALNGIIMEINTRRVRGIPVVVFNPLSWERSDIVTVQSPISRNGTVVVRDESGRGIPCESECLDDDFVTVSFIAEKIPSLGYRVYALERVDRRQQSSHIPGNSQTMENSFYRLEINPLSGNLKSIFNKILKKEFVAPGKEANMLWVYEDRPENWDAWNIGYTGRGWEINRADSVELVKVSPVRTSCEIKKSFLGFVKERMAPTEDYPSSFFTQTITLYNNLDRIDIVTEADWWETHLSLKAVFPVDVSAGYASYEIPFAAIQRTTRFETLWEKARYEVPALKWADLSDGRSGISLLNDSKYGYDIHGNTMKLSLLRSPTWPDPVADRGKHAFTYSIYTHAGDVSAASTVHRGFELNNPLIPVIATRHKGSLPLCYSFVGLKGDTVILDTIKKAEASNDWIVRLYESVGRPGKALVTFFKPVKKIMETDLLENTIREIPRKNNSLEVGFKKFEIRTFRISF